MCLIAHRSINRGDRGSNISNEIIEYNLSRNPDGFGIAWRDGQTVNSKKFGPKEGEAFRELLKSIDKKTKIEYVAHWRLATHGPACEALSHPFSYDDKHEGEVLIFHNGIIDIRTNSKKESDTSAFVDQVLKHLPSGWWRKRAYQFLVESSIGWSRLLIMTVNETVRMAKGWKDIGGIWYSTDPLPKPAAVVPYNGASQYNRRYSKSDLIDADRYDDDDTDEYYRMMGLADESDSGVEDEDMVLIEAKSGSSTPIWTHMGHPIMSLSEDDDADGDSDDRVGEAVCQTCNTTGEYYIYSGKVYIDIAHAVNTPDQAV